jgi:hypothetical protein
MQRYEVFLDLRQRYYARCFIRLDKPILEDWCEPREQIFDGRSHLCHSNDVDDCLESGEDGTENLRILLTKILVKNNPKMTK